MVKNHLDNVRGRKKEGNILVNDTLNTFLIWLICVGLFIQQERKPASFFLINNKGWFK